MCCADWRSDIRTGLGWIVEVLEETGLSVEVDSGAELTGVSIDTRKGCEGKLFVALEGENQDGHDYVADAAERGAAAALVRASRAAELEGAAGRMPLLGVEDPLGAMQLLARRWLDRTGARVVGITGSTGKTGTKELVSAILSRKMKVHSTAGNYNNQIGLPLTVLSMPAGTEVLVAEMGASHSGDIRLLVSIAPPDVAVITNIGPGHLGHFGSVEKVAAAKAEIVEGLAGDSTAVLPFDDEYFEFLAGKTKAGIVSFGFGEGASMRIENESRKDSPGYTFEIAGHPFETNRYGRHLMLNAAAAVAAAREAGAAVEDAVEAVAASSAVDGRGVVYDVAGIRFVDDSYNSNPASLQAALESFMEMPAAGRRWLVLGDMLELGEASEELHAEMGALCGKAGVDGLLTLGEKTTALNREAAVQRKAPENISHFLDHGKLAAYLDSFLDEGDIVLVKGSRGMRMEEVIEAVERLREAGRKRVV